MKKDFRTQNSDYWSKQDEWQLGQVFSDVEKRQYDFIEKYFIPYLNNDHVLCDIGCTSAYFTIIVADYVNRVDAFEYSEKMVNALSEQLANTNINIKEGDVLTLDLECEYDEIMLMGVLVYISTLEECNMIAQKLYNSMKSGGVLIIKDSMQLGEDTLYMLNKYNGYVGVYRTPDACKSIFENVGFKLVEEEIIRNAYKESVGTNVQVRMYIWKKI